MPIVFIGDFFQLEPVTGKPLYMFKESLLWEMALNMMIELKGEWRFRNCERLRKAFPGYRIRGIDEEARRIFNSRVVGSKDLDGNKVEMPDIRKTKVATYTNRLKEVFNEAVFMEHLKKNHSTNENDDIPNFTVIIKGNPSHSHNGKQFTAQQRFTFFSKCSEADTVFKGNPNKRISPLLKLFQMCSVMGIDNTDVGGGVANGTTALFRHIKLKPNRERHKIKYNGYWVWAVNAEDIEYMQLEWTKDSAFQGTFTINPVSTECISTINVEEFGRKVKIPWHTKILQFRLTSNQATTGHKLQGKSVDHLVVGQWCKVKNWIYVVLSRVRTLEGLYLLKKLPEDIKTEPDPMLTAMMDRLRFEHKILFREDTQMIAEIRNRSDLVAFKKRASARNEKKNT